MYIGKNLKVALVVIAGVCFIDYLLNSEFFSILEYLKTFSFLSLIFLAGYLTPKR